MNATQLLRAGVPEPLVSDFIGHLVARMLEGKASDGRLKDYAYALGHTMADIVKVTRIICSNFKETWTTVVAPPHQVT